MYQFTKGKIYYIVWADHWSDGEGGWQHHEESVFPIYLKSIGWCTAESDEVVRIVGHMEQDTTKGPNRSGDITILKGAIKQAWELTNVE